MRETCVDGGAGEMGFLPSEEGSSSSSGGGSGSVRNPVDDNLRFYPDSAADEVLGVGVQTDGDGPISTVQKPQGVHVCAC